MVSLCFIHICSTFTPKILGNNFHFDSLFNIFLWMGGSTTNQLMCFFPVFFVFGKLQVEDSGHLNSKASRNYSIAKDTTLNFQAGIFLEAKHVFGENGGSRFEC